MSSLDSKPNRGFERAVFGSLLGLGPLLDFFDTDRAIAEYRHALEQEMRSRVELARAIAQERQAMVGVERSSETIRREEELQALELENSEGHRITYLNLRALDENDSHVCFDIRFVKPGDPVSDADRESYAKWCEMDKERQALIRKNSDEKRIAKGAESEWIN
jgi:hypothetical protein